MKKIVTISELGIIITGNTLQEVILNYMVITPLLLRQLIFLKLKNILIIQKNIIRKKDIISI